MKVAVIQLQAGIDIEKNIKNAEQLVLKAARCGAKLIVLPEIFNFRGKATQKSIVNNIAENISGPSINGLVKIAKEKSVCIVAGSIYEKSSSKKKVYNTSVFISETGRKTIYRKMHLFNAKLSKGIISESERLLTGNNPVIVRAFGLKMGLSICYDLRFPELYKYYAKKGVDIICVPSAFTYETGKAHWEVLLRARAIETQTYILAPNQVGKDSKGQKCYGHSMIVDPWGKVVSNAQNTKEKIIYSKIEKNKISKVRRALPGFNKSM